MRPMTKAGPLVLLVTAVLIIAGPQSALAVGTAANTTISNTATVDYDVGGVPQPPVSGTIDFQVDELVDVTVTWQDAANVQVVSGHQNAVLTFQVDNVGNGPETFDLTVDNSLGGDNFDPTLVNIYPDVGSDGVFVPGVDDAAAISFVSLSADESATVFVANNIPAATAGQLGNSQLTATSQTGTGAGAVVAGAGDGGTDAVIGNSGGQASDNGTYEVITVVLTVAKTVTAVSDPFGGTAAIPGATIEYTITVTNPAPVGGPTATNVIITDPIPATTSFTGPINVNVAATSDYGITTAGAVTVELTDPLNPQETATITFVVTIL